MSKQDKYFFFRLGNNCQNCTFSGLWGFSSWGGPIIGKLRCHSDQKEQNWKKGPSHWAQSTDVMRRKTRKKRKIKLASILTMCTFFDFDFSTFIMSWKRIISANGISWKQGSSLCGFSFSLWGVFPNLTGREREIEVTKTGLTRSGDISEGWRRS